MPAKRVRGNPVPVSDLTAAILDPVLRRRAGISVGLVQSWEEIVGVRLARLSRPERLQWPRRLNEDDPFRPAALVIACEGLAALHLQHQQSEVVARVNAFLGFTAVDRLRIVQKPVAPIVPQARARPRALTLGEATAVDRTVSGIEDDGLRDALRRLGASVIGSAKR